MHMQQDFSFWEFETYSREWDICIIGSGITGLSTGISLLEKNPQLQILVVDRWFIPLGASTRMPGFPVLEVHLKFSTISGKWEKKRQFR
jgi:hypothetical protein